MTSPFTQPLDEYSQVTHIRDCIGSKKFPIRVTGCTDSQKGNLIAALETKTRLIVAPDEIKARELFADYLLYDKNALFYPAKDVIFYNADVRGSAIVIERQKCIRRLLENGNVAVFTSIQACLDKIMAPSRILENVIRIDRNSHIDFNELSAKLVAIGYNRVDETTQPGEFAIRGGIIDIYPVAEENPYRIEMWGDEIDIIKVFDPVSQRSIDNAEEFSIYPAFEYVFDDAVMKKGVEAIEKETQKQNEYLRKEMKTEEAARLRRSVAEFKENLEFMRSAVNLDSYVDYFTKDTVSFLDYFDDKDTLTFIDEPARTFDTAEAIDLEFEESMKGRLEKGYILPGQMTAVFNYRKVFGKIAGRRLIMMSTMEYKFAEIKAVANANFEVRAVSSYNGNFMQLVEELKTMKKKGYKVILLTSSASRASRLAENLCDEEITAFVTQKQDRVLQPGEVMVASGSLSRGFDYPLIKFAMICETDIYGRQKKERKKKAHSGSTFDLGQLENGDYVVHESYGIGIYRGMEKIEVNNVIKDYVKIEYAAGGTLYVHAAAMDLLQKYSGPEGSKPKINKLDSPNWRNTTAKVRGAVKEIAEDLVKLYAARQARRGFAYSPDTFWQREFEEMFPFEETYDQQKAIEETKKDMESEKIMDRLICGDVGFGKTEVAIRAAFKAVQDGKQVAVLAPTTVLVQQHFNTFLQRMSEFAVNVAQLSRFATPTQVKNTIAAMKAGKVDVVIGTHRLLSKDIGFKNLGL
ncbi:MAG: DEAD/DEAH box helicase, partial [Lachnospiraceae bacterium]|nr:DEAD/DEAH box helicase [Lachnospiraceae bacterium]